MVLYLYRDKEPCLKSGRSSKIKCILEINENIWAIIQRYIMRVEIVPIATVLGMQA